MYRTAISEPGHSHSTHTDTSTETFVPGDRVVLPCNPLIKSDVLWAYHSVSATKPLHEIFVDGVITNEFVSRFSMSTTEDGFYNLVITHSQRSDAGLFICMEDNGAGQSHYVQLIPACKSVLDLCVDKLTVK